MVGIFGFGLFFPYVLVEINVEVGISCSDSVFGKTCCGESRSPVEGQVEEADVVLQTRRELGQASGRAVHDPVTAAAGAHRRTNGQHPTSQELTEQQDKQRGWTHKHCPGSAGGDHSGK